MKRRKMGTGRRIVSPFAVFPVLFALFLGACLNDSANANRENSGSVTVTLVFDRVGSLAKPSVISMRMLYLTAHAVGEDTLRDSTSLSGNGVQASTRSFVGLATGKTWTVTARAVDQAGKVVYGDSAVFTVPAGGNTNVTLTLAARYSMLTARFFPIRDSVTSVSLFVDELMVEDSSFAKQSKVGDTVSLNYDYLPASPGGKAVSVQLDARGDYFGQVNTLLYRGRDTISVFSGKDSTYVLTLQWMYPSPPPFGQGTIQVTLGAVGKALINGAIEEGGQSVRFTVADLGGAGISAGVAHNWNMKLDTAGRPVVAYQDAANGNKLTVLRWNGTTWTALGGAGFSTGQATRVSLALDRSGHPVVGYCDITTQRNLTVVRWTGSAWSMVGAVGSVGTCTNSAYADISVAIDTTNNPVVAISEEGDGNLPLTVLKWTGSAWTSIGSRRITGSNRVYYPYIITDGSGFPVVASSVANSGGQFNNPQVSRWNGASWYAVGGSLPNLPSSSSSVANHSVLLDQSGHPIIAFDQSGVTSIFRWNGESWSGTSLPAHSPSLALDKSNNLVVAATRSADGRPVLYRLYANVWSVWVDPGILGTTSRSSLAIDRSGNPVLAFQDASDGNKLTVIRTALEP